MIKSFCNWLDRWTVKQAAIFLLASVLLAFFTAFALGKEFAQASYLFTVPAGLVLSGFNFVLAWKARYESLILSVTGAIIGVFMMGFAIEEAGWTAWRFYYRPVWFELHLSPFLKAVQSAGMIANVACLAWFFTGRNLYRLPVVALVTAGTVLSVGTILAFLIALSL